MQRTCRNCGEKYTTREARSKYCGRSCAASRINRGKRKSPESRRRCSESLKKYWKNQPARKVVLREQGKRSHKGHRRKPKNIFDMSPRSRVKVLRRLDLRCSRCGWNLELCDLHHIHGRKVADPHNHKKLSYLCPNDHRLAERGHIPKELLVPFDEQVGDRWLEMYYG